MRKVISVIEQLSNIGGYFSGWLVVMMMILVIFEVLMRYVFHHPPIIADEMSAYMLVGISFIGLAYTWKEKGHIRLEALTNRLPTMVTKWMRLFTLIGALAYVFLASKVSYEVVLQNFARDVRSATWLRVPLYIPQIAMVIGFSLLALILIVEVIKASIRLGSATDIKEEAT